MRNLFDPNEVDEMKQRLARLTPESPRQWGKMNVAQMVAHCCIGFQSAMGEVRPPRGLLGVLIGRSVKRVALRDEKPMLRNAQAAGAFIVTGNPDFVGECDRLRGMVDRFAAAGPAGCTTHPHFFFGRLTPEEWSVLMYKHLDHHLRQFGV